MQCSQFNPILYHSTELLNIFSTWSGSHRQLNTNSTNIMDSLPLLLLFTIISYAAGFRLSCWIKCWTADNIAKSARTWFTVSPRTKKNTKSKTAWEKFFAWFAGAVTHESNIAFFSRSDRHTQHSSIILLQCFGRSLCHQTYTFNILHLKWINANQQQEWCCSTCEKEREKEIRTWMG